MNVLGMSRGLVVILIFSPQRTQRSERILASEGRVDTALRRGAKVTRFRLKTAIIDIGIIRKHASIRRRNKVALIAMLSKENCVCLIF